MLQRMALRLKALDHAPPEPEPEPEPEPAPAPAPEPAPEPEPNLLINAARQRRAQRGWLQVDVPKM